MTTPTTALERVPRAWWVAAIAGSVALAITPGMSLLPGAPSGSTPSALSVLTAQKTAMEAEDPDLRARALELGAAYLERGPDGPYRDLIEAGHAELDARQ